MNVICLLPPGPLPTIIPPFPEHWQRRTVHSAEEMTEDVLGLGDTRRIITAAIARLAA